MSKVMFAKVLLLSTVHALRIQFDGESLHSTLPNKFKMPPPDALADPRVCTICCQDVHHNRESPVQSDFVDSMEEVFPVGTSKYDTLSPTSNTMVVPKSSDLAVMTSCGYFPR